MQYDQLILEIYVSERAILSTNTIETYVSKRAILSTTTSDICLKTCNMISQYSQNVQEDKPKILLKTC